MAVRKPKPGAGHDQLCPCELCLGMAASRNLRLRLYLLAIRRIADAHQAACVRSGVPPGAASRRIGALAAFALGRPYPAPATDRTQRRTGRRWVQPGRQLP